MGANVPESRIGQLTRAFYQWERRGRGWRVWPDPVALEPPFQPFHGHAEAQAAPVDDGRRHTLLSGIVERVRSWFTDQAGTPARPDAEEPTVVVLEHESPVVELSVIAPKSLRVTASSAGQLLSSLAHATGPVAIEFVGSSRSVQVFLACHEVDASLVQRQIEGHFPDAIVTKASEGLDVVLGPRQPLVVDFGLGHEWMLPLRVPRALEPDPVTGVVAALSGLEEQEAGTLQVLFEPARHAWASSAVRAVTSADGTAFFLDAPDLPPLARSKVERPLFAVVVRAAASCRTEERSWELIRALAGALEQFSDPRGNQLIPLTNDGYDDAAHVEDLLRRRSRRSGMLLNADELLALAHLPDASLRAPKLVRSVKRTRPAPDVAQGEGVVLGENTHAARTVTVTLGDQLRTRHVYVIGASGTGKSTLLLNMIAQDLRAGEGVGVLDPHGDLVDEVLAHVPDERIDDVVLLDPADPEYAVGLNLLSGHSDLEKRLLSSDLVAVFQRLSTSWGDQMTSVLGNAVLAFLESSRGGTLADLRRFLVEPEYRKEFLKTVEDEEVLYYWKRSFPLLSGKPQAPLLTRLDTFLRPRLIRHMVAQRDSRIDFADVMSGGKIFLAKLAQGAIGEENAYVLGALLVSKLHQIAQSRQGRAASERRRFQLYIDEFHHFLTPSTAAVLSGARKYGLGLVLAHQDLSQLGRRETGVLGAAITNPATRICFRVGDLDARRLDDGFASFDTFDLQSLDVGEAICRIEQAQHDFNLRTYTKPNVDGETAARRRERIVANSRERYGTPRSDVEKSLRDPRQRQETRSSLRNEEERRREPPLREVGRAAAAPARDASTAVNGPRRETKAGKGGPQHKYLQQLIKRWAVARGWKAAIEHTVLDGHGSIDVALEKGGSRIACEITVTTGAEYELGNLQKCLAAGYEQVALVSADRSHLNRVRRRAQGALTEGELDKIAFLIPEELFEFLEERDVPADSESEVRGYKVKVEYEELPREEKQARVKAISRVLREALKRLKGRE